MPFKIVRNDITRMNCDAIVNTANCDPVVGPGCDTAVYAAAGYEELITARELIGPKEEGESFVTQGFKLPARYIIHTVSPRFRDGNSGEEEKLRNCYRSSLALAAEYGLESIAFPLISTGSFGYPKEEGMRIAIDEINAFLIKNQMMVYLVVFDEQSTNLGRRIVPELEAYIDRHYYEQKFLQEYAAPTPQARPAFAAAPKREPAPKASHKPTIFGGAGKLFSRRETSREESSYRETSYDAAPYKETSLSEDTFETADFDDVGFDEFHGDKLKERMAHMTDTFSEYLIYLIESKGMKNADVYKRAIVDKKVFSKIKNNPDAHPQKITAMCLCVGAMLNLDETRDLLARAGYALSPCDKRDVIFSYFIENQIYDMIELDIQLESHGLPCLIE